MIISAFKRTAGGEIINATVAKTHGEVVSCKSQIMCGACEQQNIDLVVLGKTVAVSVLFGPMENAFFKLFIF